MEAPPVRDFRYSIDLWWSYPSFFYLKSYFLYLLPQNNHFPKSAPHLPAQSSNSPNLCCFRAPWSHSVIPASQLFLSSTARFSILSVTFSIRPSHSGVQYLLLNSCPDIAAAPCPLPLLLAPSAVLSLVSVATCAHPAPWCSLHNECYLWFWKRSTNLDWVCIAHASAQAASWEEERRQIREKW